MTKIMTLTQHKQAADLLKPIKENLSSLFCLVANNTPLSEQEVKDLEKMQQLLKRIKCKLDKNFHQTITDDEFKQLGNIYYK